MWLLKLLGKLPLDVCSEFLNNDISKYYIKTGVRDINEMYDDNMRELMPKSKNAFKPISRVFQVTLYIYLCLTF